MFPKPNLKISDKINCMKNDIKKILVINFGGIGDEILFFPTLKSIKKSFKNAKITLALEPRSKSAFTLTNLVDNVITCDIKSNFKYLNALKLIFHVWQNNYDMVVSSGSSRLVGRLLGLMNIPLKYGYDSGSESQKILTKTVRLNTQQYAAKMYHDLAVGIDENAQFSIPEVIVPSELTQWADQIIQTIDRKNIVIHPGVSQLSLQKGIKKVWSAKKWAKLIKKLCETGNYRVIITGGPDDSKIIKKINKKLNKIDANQDCILDLYGKTKNIVQLAAIIKKADLMICADSAPMHVSVGVETNTIAIFGPTDEKKLLPAEDKRFLAIVNDNTDCRPCLWDKRVKNCNKSKCLDISEEKVFKIIQEFFK